MRKDSNRAKQEAFHQVKAKYMVEKKQWAADKKAGLVDSKFPMPKPKLGKLPGQKPKPGVAVDDGWSSSSSMEGGMNGGESDNSADDYF